MSENQSIEQAFNLFLYMDEKKIVEVGYAMHPIDTDDDSLIKRMQSTVNDEHKTAKRFPLEHPLEYDNYIAMARLDSHYVLFEKIFEIENAVANPLMLITCIADGKPLIDQVTTHDPLVILSKDISPAEQGEMMDYLKEYTCNKGFDIPRLIHDDYFKAIKILFNEQLWISGFKLVLSCIDSISFVEFGDLPAGESFKRWLNAYTNISSLDITAEDLWELRNGLLHMTNLDSRKVIKNLHPRIILSVGEVSKLSLNSQDSKFKYLDIYKFYDLLKIGISKWAYSYSEDPKKLLEFVRRYDLTVSDSRLAKIQL